MINVIRGFRRIVWLLVAASVPGVAFIAYQSSSRQTGYEARLITSDFPSSVDSYQGKVSVAVANIGFVYFPTSFSKTEMEVFLKHEFPKAVKATSRAGVSSISDFAAKVRSKYPEYQRLNDTELTKSVLTKYPVYRSDVDFKEFEVVPKFGKRPLWALAVTVGICGGLALALHGLIAAIAWVVRGFKTA